MQTLLIYIIKKKKWDIFVLGTKIISGDYSKKKKKKKKKKKSKKKKKKKKRLFKIKKKKGHSWWDLRALLTKKFVSDRYSARVTIPRKIKVQIKPWASTLKNSVRQASRVNASERRERP